MPIPAVSRLVAKVAGKLSLRTVLIVPFVLQTVGTVGLVGYLSFKSGQDAVEDLAQQLMTQVGERVSDRLSTYLQAPQTAVATNHLAVEQGLLNIQDFEQLQQQFWQQITLNSSLEVIEFANESAEEIGYGRFQSEELVKQAEKLTGENLSIYTPYFNILKSTDPGKRKYFLADSKGNPRKHIYTFPIDNRTVPWYRAAKAAKQQTWSPIYRYKIVPLLGIDALAPIYDADGKWRGAFISRFLLSTISTFLNQLHFSPSGQVFIMERSGKLVATSTLETLLVKQPKGEPEQLLAVNSKDTRTREIAQQLIRKFGNFHTLQTTQQFNLVSHQKRQFVQVTPYRDKYGLDWLVVVVVPESDFMEQINTNTRITILLCIAALIGSTSIGIFTARWITQPIVRLNNAAKDIARGEWDNRVELERTDEVGQLANSFNTMAAQRKQAEELLAHYNRTLEAQVAERTAELVQANDQLRREIAERELVEGKLYSSTQQVRTIFESISDIVLIIDAQKSVQVMPTKMLGSYTCDTNLLNRIVEHFFEYDTEENWFAKVQQVLETQQNVNFDYSLSINNQEVWFTACISPLPDNSVVWVARDISDRKRAELELHSAQQRLQYLLTSSPAVIFSALPGGDYNLTCMSENVSIILGYDAQEFLNSSQFWAMHVHPEDMKGILSQLPQLFQQGACAYEYRFLHADGTYHWLYTQLRLVKDEMGNPQECVGYLIDINDKKLAEEQRQESEKRYRELFEKSVDGIVSTDMEGRFLNCNASYQKILGYSLEELRQATYQELTPSQWYSMEVEIVEQQIIARGYSDTYEKEYIRKDGTVFPVEINAYCQKNEAGQPETMWAIVRDISDRKLVEQALQASQARFAGILEIANDAIITVDASQCITLFNQGAEKIFGYKADEVLGQHLDLLLPTRLREIHHQHVTHFSNSVGKARPMGDRSEIFGCRKDGTEFPAEASISKLEINGEKVFTTFLRDISERKQAEKALIESEERYRSVITAMSEGVVLQQANGAIIAHNESAQRILGLTADQMTGRTSVDLDWRTIQEDGSPFPGDRHPAMVTLRTGQPQFNVVMGICKSNATKTWITINSQPLFHPGETLPYAVVTSFADITERKLAEEALRQYERIVSATADAMVLVDRNYIYQVANQTYLAWHNKQYEEIVGHSISEIMGTDVFENLMKERLDRALAGETVAWQTWIELAVGRRFVSVTYSPYFETDNTISGLVASISDITELKQTEEKLRQTNQEMQAIFAAFPDILFRLAADGTILDYKTKQDDNLYTSPETFLGKKVQGVLPPPVGQNIQAAVRRVLQTDSPVSLEYSLPMPEGEQYFDARMVRFHEDEVIAVTRNISDRKLAEERLRQSESQLNTIVTTTSDGIMILDREGKVRFANPAATALLNLSLDEFVDYRWGIPIGEIAEIEIVVSKEETRTVEMKATRTQWLGEPAFVLALRDISDRKRAEAALQQAVEAADTANRAKSTFLANMSHELRTPLNGILGYAQILQADKNCTPKQQDGINIIYQCGTHLLTLINDILDLSKIEAEKLELYPETINFSVFLTEVVEIFKLKAIQKDIKFTYLPLNLPPRIQADKKRLRQVLMNLLSNAVKFTDRGHVTFKVALIDNEKQDQLPITNHQSPITKIRFEIEDTGIGIPPNQLEKIFLPFEQVGDKSRRSEGTGLGLAITQKILEMMGSQIYVESTPQVGSKFWFDVDLPSISTPKNLTPVKSTTTIIGYSGEKRKILVVDDRWENCAVLINMLEPIGFELVEAANGQEGLEKAIEFQPDLILVDLVMPIMDGYQMTRKLRQLPEFQTTTLIAISANAFEFDRQQSLDSGCNDFLPKPVQAEDLFDKIKDYLNLSWIYDNTEELESSQNPPSLPQEIVIPPGNELLALHQAVLIGDVEGVEYESIRLQDVSPDYIPFVIRVLELAQDFEYEEIAKLIEPYLL